MLAINYVFIPHSIQCPLAIRSELQVSITCLADNNNFGTSRPELSYLSLLVGREPRCHLNWLADDTKGINITGAIWRSAVQISDADTSETVMLPRLGITGDANLPHDFCLN